MNIKSIKKSLNSPAYKDLRKYLISEIVNLSNIEEIKDIDNPEDLAIEVKAQKKAAQKLKSIVGRLDIWKKSDAKNLKETIEKRIDELGL